ncbi:hypothetical protein GIW81_02085 [Hyphomicrobium sp. xq]|uniref:Phage tail assembly chaperone protein, E, or 41 or 14 n=1 Tax=Hyphomicrobium album TaxID=2665159 RepID=A0A6I3KFP2_9HYPH|nr:phage tail assembly protein [Hyphomicrobium album]MTD93119.1 hypothetical protein [Hyphomicrobium album]
MTGTKPVELKLAYPIDYQGATIATLKLRRPKGRDMRFLPDGSSSVEKMFPFFALLAGVEEGVLDEMDAADLTRLGAVVTDFLSDSQKAAGRR